MGNNIHILNHPLLQHKLSILRDEHTGTNEFRKVVSEIASLMTYEATRDLPTRGCGCKDSSGYGTLQGAGRQEDRHRPHPPCRSGHGGRRAGNAAHCQGRSHRPVS